MAHEHANIDWTDRLHKATTAARENLNRSEAIVPRYALQHVGPYIELLAYERHLTWAPSSEVNVKAVTAAVMARLNIGSTKGLPSKSEARRRAIAEAALFRDAVQFYASCCIIGAATGYKHNADKCRVPFHWFAQKLREYDSKTDQLVVPDIMLPIQREAQDVQLRQESGLSSPVTVNVTMKAINAIARPAPVAATSQSQAGSTTADAGSTNASGQQRAPGGAASGTASGSGTSLTLATLLSAASSMMARTGWIVTGDNADALADFLKSFAEGHPLNRALLLEIATTAPMQAAPTDAGTTIDGECQEVTPPLAIEHDYTPTADVIEIADHVGNAIAA